MTYAMSQEREVVQEIVESKIVFKGGGGIRSNDFK